MVWFREILCSIIQFSFCKENIGFLFLWFKDCPNDTIENCWCLFLPWLASFIHFVSELYRKFRINWSFLQTGGHHTREDYAVRGKEPKDEVQIYTWKDANLRELTDLVCIYDKGCVLMFDNKAACFRQLYSEYCLKYDRFQLKELALFYWWLIRILGFRVAYKGNGFS